MSAGILVVGKVTAAAGYAGQANSYGHKNQTGIQTTIGYVSVTASYAGSVAESAGAAKAATQLGHLGGALGLVQVGISYANSGGDSTKLTAGDVINVLAAVTTLTPGLQPVGILLAGVGVAYSFYESKNGAITVGDITNYWLDRLDDSKEFKDYKNINRDGKYHIVDPLVLDLDGDGIETVGTQGYKGALFDHDKDGIRTATGWVSADDGLLVTDRNSDGLINNGAELFGDSTVLKDGTNAAHGFAALAEFDSNGDGKVNTEDADFAKLKVWRDLNQDGVSQEGELFTLAELGIQSLDTAYQDVNTRLGNGNSIAQKGGYTLSDGTAREMGDLLLANDTLHSRYADSVKLTDEQMQASNVQGIGRLREAA